MIPKTRITPIILCGGAGTRLWPLSRQSYPKQFVELTGAETLFQAAARRLSGKGEGFDFGAPLIVTNSDFRFIITEQLTTVEIVPEAILIEPHARNTAPAVLAAALKVLSRDPDSFLLVAPSDHAIEDDNAFLMTISKGLIAASEGRLVTFGITPDRPETSYGYLQLKALPDGSGEALELERFVEKPTAEKAEMMLADGCYLWNSGIFLFRARDIVEAFHRHAAGLVAPVKAALDGAHLDLGFIRLAEGPWMQAENISIDYAIMENADNLSVVPFAGAWSDLGGWDALWRESQSDSTGVVKSERATAIDCHNSLLRSEAETIEVVGIGLDNMVVVAMPDAVLVASMDRAQDVKLAVSALKAKKAKQATLFPRDHRPWGWFESLVIAERFQVKRIVVHPGASLSLQSHFHRSEHWIVVEGTARVTLDGVVTIVTENQSVYVPLGAVHRLENPGKVQMVLIEVQTGSYLGEDDIVRYEDIYSRH